MAPAGRPWTSVMDADELLLAGVYAQAALANQPGDAEAEETAGELDALLGLVRSEPLLEYVLLLAPMSVSARREAVGRIFRDRCGRLTEGLLGVLARRDRLNLLPAVARRFRALLNRRQGRVEVAVTTAVELDDQTRRQVREAVAAMIGASPILRETVDPDLVGGMVVSAGGRVYDDSIRSELSRMRRGLVQTALGRHAKAGGSHEASAP